MKIFLLLLLSIVVYKVNAQSKVSILGGWTASKVRTLYDKNVNKGPAFMEAADMTILNAPYLGIEYEYAYKKLYRLLKTVLLVTC